MAARPEPDPLTRWRTHLEAQLQPGRDAEQLVSLSLTRVCAMTRDEVGLAGAALTVMTEDGTQVVVAASDRASRSLEQLTFAIGEGPSLEAFTRGRPVFASDLERELGRWPGWAPAASALGVGAVFAFPVQLGAVRFGALVAHAPRPRILDEAEVRRCLVLAEIATDLLLASSTHGSPGSPDPDLQQAMHLRSEIYQAQGMVMVSLDVSLAEALTRMRAHAFVTGHDLAEVALGIIAGRVTLTRDAGATTPPPENEAP